MQSWNAKCDLMGKLMPVKTIKISHGELMIPSEKRMKVFFME